MILESFFLDAYRNIILFAAYSFIGWVLEVIYRSLPQKRFVNAGFLYGPFVPIYGVGALLIISLSIPISKFPVIAQLFCFGVATTIIELITGLAVEKYFGFKLWDYSDNKYNYKGIICPLYSVFWALMSVFFISLLHPEGYRLAKTINPETSRYIAYLFTIYFIFDSTLTISKIMSLKKWVRKFIDDYNIMDNVQIAKYSEIFQRFFKAFPDINYHFEKIINQELQEKINSVAKLLKSKTGRKTIESSDDEFYGIIDDIISNEEFLRTKNYYHHNSSIYDHIMEVAYISYRLSKKLKLDFVSATRGAMLHDFFCYDWRNHDEPDLAKEKFHGFEHPRIAYLNAQKYFALNDIEKDIILKHMWPLTIIPPKYKESYIVTFADKYTATREYTIRIKKSVGEKLNTVKNKFPGKIIK